MIGSVDRHVFKMLPCVIPRIVQQDLFFFVLCTYPYIYIYSVFPLGKYLLILFHHITITFTLKASLIPIDCVKRESENE